MSPGPVPRGDGGREAEVEARRRVKLNEEEARRVRGWGAASSVIARRGSRLLRSPVPSWNH